MKNSLITEGKNTKCWKKLEYSLKQYGIVLLLAPIPGPPNFSLVHQVLKAGGHDVHRWKIFFSNPVILVSMIKLSKWKINFIIYFRIYPLRLLFSKKFEYKRHY